MSECECVLSTSVCVCVCSDEKVLIKQTDWKGEQSAGCVRGVENYFFH